MFWTAAGERETASHVATVICQNQSQKVETVILNWVIVKDQNPEHWGLCRISVVGYKYPLVVEMFSLTLETVCADIMFGTGDD